MPAALIFIATLALIVWRPRGLGIGYGAAAGALATVLCGVVHPADIPAIWGMVWNATLAFVALVVISLILDEAGFFEWIALHVARRGGGRRRRLFVLFIVLGAAVSAFFANDGAALILTPIVVAMLAALRFGPAAMLAYAMAAGFIADTASLPLLISNLVNIVTADYFGIGFARYAATMAPVTPVAVLTSLGMLLWRFGADVGGGYDAAGLPAPAGAVRDRFVFAAGWWVLAALLACFFLAGPAGVPLCVPALAGAVALLLAAGRGTAISTRRVMRQAPWHIVIFSLGMYVVVYGLRNQGYTAYLAGALDYLAARGSWSATLGTGMLMALLSSVMNNLPAVLAGSLAIDASHAAGPIREAMIHANIIGCDLGPKFTPIGSLASLLWLHVLERKGVRIGWGYYCRYGLLLTLPVLMATLAALALRLGV